MVLRLFAFAWPALLALYMPSCRTPVVQPSVPPGAEVRMSELWERPANLHERDLVYGGWGRAYAPDPSVTYTFLEPKRGGTNPGMTVRDPQGRRWHVKQQDPGRGAEGPPEVTLARILEAVGYHQPPVYFLHGFKLRGDGPQRIAGGGRFRLDVPELEKHGDWAWQENPFVGTKPYQGLLAILLLFNSSDLKNSNNALYHYRGADGEVQRWYVVRDLGMALGNTGKLDPNRGDVNAYERTRYTLGVEDGFVRFAYRGFHQELVTRRLTAGDVAWGCELLAGLSESQWRDAFRAGGFDHRDASRFIRVIQERIREGRALGPSGTGG